MSQDPNPEDAAKVEKLLIDKPSDFKYHAAYLAYSEAWDRATSPEGKAQLNQIITSLSKDEIDAETFYTQINQFRGGASPGHQSFSNRIRIETQRKKDWRKREAKSARQSRHRR